MKLEPRLQTAEIILYEDIDKEQDKGYQLAEVNFSDGSKILMHKNQFDAISVSAAKIADTILYNAGEGPMPKWLEEKRKDLGA